MALAARYERILRPAFGELSVSDADGGFVQISLDGEDGDFALALYGPGHARVYWEGECFIFDSRREELTSSDTFGEIVYEGEVCGERLLRMVAELVLWLKDCAFIGKEEDVRGRTLSGYDEVRDYTVYVRTADPLKVSCRLDNITLVPDFTAP